VSTRILPRLPGWLWLVAAMTVVGPVSIDMYLPGFPLIEREFGSGVEHTMAAYLFGIALSPLVYGPLSDRFGRKPPLYFSLALYTAGSLGCVLAGSMGQLLAMRVAQACGAGAGFVIGRAIVRDRCEPHETARVFSLLMLIFSLGPILAPGVGGLIIGWWGWRAAFWFQVLLGLGLLLMMHLTLRETQDPAHVVPLRVRNIASGYGRLLVDRAFIGFALVGGFGMSTTFSYVTGASNVMGPTYGLAPRELGLLLGLNGLAFMLASRLNTLALRRHGPTEILHRAAAGPLLCAALLVGATAFVQPPLAVFVALQLALFVAVGRVNPNSAALALARHGRQAGTASALLGSIQSLMGTLAGVNVATFTNGTVNRLALLMAIPAACAWLSYRWVRGQQSAGEAASR